MCDLDLIIRRQENFGKKINLFYRLDLIPSGRYNAIKSCSHSMLLLMKPEITSLFRFNDRKNKLKERVGEKMTNKTQLTTQKEN